MIKASIIGATGYTGVELIRILLGHPQVEIDYLISESYSGQELNKVFPHLAQTINTKYPNLCFSKLDIDKIAAHSDVVFLALPHTASIPLVEKLLAYEKIKIIDLSADLRLNDGGVYKKWYKHQPASDEILQRAVYGLPEIDKIQQIKNTNLIANPGCYPTASILAVAPLLVNNIVDVNQSNIILDAKSGVSGAGRSASLVNHYCEVSDSFSAYQIAGVHRHIPEIEKELAILAKQKVTVGFTPHLVPMPRGIMVTAYCKLNHNSLGQKYTLTELVDLYKEYYNGKYFIRITEACDRPSTKSVTGSNFCDISVHLDERTGYAVIVSVIDNLVKGASGQAVQNMNLMCSLPEHMGLEQFGVYP